MSYREIIGWQNGMVLVEEIYRFTATLPSSEKFGLRQQLERASVAIPSNIAEGYGRSTKADFARFVTLH
jgi:hypothetical protein